MSIQLNREDLAEALAALDLVRHKMSYQEQADFVARHVSNVPGSELQAAQDGILGDKQ